MKKIYLLILIILVAVFSAPGIFAQVPDGFNYQAIARDVTTGEPLQNTSLNVRIAILSSVNPDVVVWEEEHSLSTNEYGLFTLQVGDLSASYFDGSAVSFSAIDWASGTYYLRPGIMQSGGSWQLMTPTKLIAVPFSMLAKDVENKQELTKSGNFILLTDGGSVDLSEYIDPDQTIELDGTTLSISGSNSSVDLSDFIDPNQEISKSGNTVSLSGGGGSFSLTEYENQFDANADTLSKVDGSLVLGSQYSNGSILKVVGNEPDPVAPLFEVKNQAGQSIFAVYDNGVHIHVDDKTLPDIKSSRGGFVVAGFDDDVLKDIVPGTAQEYLQITPDYARVFVPNNPAVGAKAPGSRGGFAVGGFDADKKGDPSLYFNVSGQNEVDTVLNSPRMLWYPQKEAFQAGRINILSADSVGLNSTAFGYHPTASGNYSQAFGNEAKASGDNSTAIGNQSVARGFDSYAFGSSARALGQKSFALGSIGVDSIGDPLGQPTTASGDYSMAMGMSSVASSRGSLALGVDSYSSGWYATALGYRSIASGSYSNAFGLRANATGPYSMALGMYSYSDGDYSLALGSRASAAGDYSIAVGMYATSNGQYSVAMGYGAYANQDYSYALGRSAFAMGLYSYSMGYGSSAGGESSYALGNNALANSNFSYALGSGARATNLHAYAIGYNAEAKETYSYAMGYNADANGTSSYSLGNGAIAGSSYSYAFGQSANAENYGSIAIGSGAHTQGNYAMAFGQNSLATNIVSTAIGFGSKSGGFGSTALGYAADARNDYSVAIGVSSIASANYAFAIGRSAQATQTNATAIGYNAKAHGANAYAFGTSTTASGAASVGLGYGNTSTVDSAIAIGNLNDATGANALAFGNSNNSSGSYSVAMGTRSGASGAFSTAIGFSAIASADRATAMGYEVSAQGYKSVSVGANYYKNLLIFIPPTLPKSGEEITTKGPDGEVWFPGEGGEEPAGTKQFIILPTIIDRDNDALDSYSVAIGGGNLSDKGGFAFGVYNDATEEYSTAIGFANKATGLYSTAIGFANAAEGVNSTAMGRYTTAESYGSFVIGTYNYLPPSYLPQFSKDSWVETDPLFVIGNGTSDTPNDAMVVDKNGYTYHEARDAFAGIRAYNYLSTRTATSYGIYSSISSSTSAKTFSGFFAGSGTGYRGLYADNFTTLTSDLAEFIYDNNNETEAADVVVADPNGKENIIRSTKPYQSSVVGIVSTDPSISMGSEIVMEKETGDDIEGVNAAQLALAGRVPCKVTDENGPIKPGDMVTSSSTPGHAMKWTLLDVTKAKDFEELKTMIAENETRRNAIIGKALESHKSGTGKIIVLISLQ